MSSDQKQNVISKTSEEERATLDANLTHLSAHKEEEDKKTAPIISISTPNAETGEIKPSHSVWLFFFLGGGVFMKLPK